MFWSILGVKILIPENLDPCLKDNLKKGQQQTAKICIRSVSGLLNRIAEEVREEVDYKC